MSESIQQAVAEAAPREAERVTTSSRFRAWWLINVRGYRKGATTRTPKLGSFGRIAYDSKWVLHPPTD